MKKTILITGASSGLGEATVRRFAENGWIVLATMRHPEQNTSFTMFDNVHLLKMNLNDAQQIVKVVAKAEQISPIDVLFNNAGYALAGPLEGMSDEQLEQQWETNFLGTVRVTRACLPYFRDRGNGVVITTTSLGAYIPNPFLSVYGATKAALASWTDGMSFELSKFGITIKTVIPGFMKTNFVENTQITTHQAYQGLLDKVLTVFSNPETTAMADNPEDIAAVVFEAATDNKTQLHYLAGKDATTKSAWLDKDGKDTVMAAMESYFFS